MRASSVDNKSFKVLIADSDAAAASQLADYLRVATGYPVAVVCDGQSAVEAAIRRRPQVIVCDMNLRYKNGLQFAEEVTRKLSYKPLLIALTAQSALDDSLFKAGFDRYYLKPVVHVEIETAIRLHELQRSLIA